MTPLPHWLQRLSPARLYEPTTALTDYLLGAQTLRYAVLLRPGANSRTAQLWVVALGAAGLAAIAGGVHHSVHPGPGDAVRRESWRVVGITTGLAAAAMLAATVYATIAPRRRPWWLAATLTKSVVFGALNQTHNDFRLIIYDYASSMLLVLALLATARPPRPGRRAVIAGILISFLAAAVQMSGITLHRHFNHNDLYHLIQAIAFHQLYTGAAQEQRAGDRA